MKVGLFVSLVLKEKHNSAAKNEYLDVRYKFERMNLSGYKYINFDYLSLNFGSEAEFWKEIVSDATESIANFCIQLNDYYDQSNWKELGETAHQLKGLVQIFGMEDLALKLKDIQLLAENNSTNENLKPLVNDSLAICQEALKELNLAKLEL